MGNLCIIPARGGSKRIPRKNIRDFMGKPIISYSIEAALQSELFDEVMVSTDDEEISEVAKKYGAKVPFMRSEKNADDFAGTVDVLLEVLNKYKELDKSFENACCIYPTAPFVTLENLQRSFEIMKAKKFITVFPIVMYSYPIQRALRLKDGKISMFQPENDIKRSQDLESAYHDTGQFYWINIAEFNKKKTLFTDNSGAIIVNETEAQDIDSENDWNLAKLKFKILKKII